MTSPDLFGGPKYDHPKLRAWSARIAAGVPATVEVRWPSDGITRLRPEIWIEFHDPSTGTVEVDDAPWESGLNAALVARRIRARDLANEARRLSIALIDAFEPLARRYGDDFFNSVLIELTADMGMTKSVELAELMNDITWYRPNRGEARDRCRDDLHAILAKIANEHVDALGYSRAEARDIVTAALAQYLDERYSVSSRRLLGWAQPTQGFWTLVADAAPRYPGADRKLKWTASASELALWCQSHGLETTAVTIERELLEHASDDASFPWTVSRDPATRRLVFTPKAA